MPERLQSLNIYLLLIIVGYNIGLNRFLVVNTSFNPITNAIIAFLTSVGFYRILILLLYFLINSFPGLKKIYWGKLYLEGFWSYTYVLEGTNNESDRRFFGVWRFEQDLFQTKVIGFGLTEDFQERSRVRSVTDLIENRGAYEIINTRTDSVDPVSSYYSKTSMLFEYGHHRIFRYPVLIRAKTVIYGGTLTGNVHRDVFNKHESAKSEQDVVETLKNSFESRDGLI